MKLAVLTSAYAAQRFIGPCIRQFDGFDLHHLVVTSSVPWHGDIKPDFTALEAVKYGAEVLLGNYDSDALQRNYGLEHLRFHGYDWALIVDSDEFYDPKSLNILIKTVENSDADVITCPNMSVYWKDMDNLIVPDPQPDNPIVAIRTNQEFSWSRLSKSPNRQQTIAHMQHFSYVRTDKEMQEKLSFSEHVHEFVPNWYENVWLNWKPGDIFLHPVIPEQFAATVQKSAPIKIRNLFC